MSFFIFIYGLSNSYIFINGLNDKYKIILHLLNHIFKTEFITDIRLKSDFNNFRVFKLINAIMKKLVCLFYQH
jgi:hypothetical protein